MAMEERLTAMENRLTASHKLHTAVEKRISGIEKRVLVRIGPAIRRRIRETRAAKAQ
jgi:hypothetical protein